MSDREKRRYRNTAEAVEGGAEGGWKHFRLHHGYKTHTHTHTQTSQTTVNLLSLAFVAGVCFNEGGGSELDSHCPKSQKEKTVSSSLNVSASSAL